MANKDVVIEMVYENKTGGGKKWLKIVASGEDYQDWEHGHVHEYREGDNWHFVYDEKSWSGGVNYVLVAGTYKIVGEERPASRHEPYGEEDRERWTADIPLPKLGLTKDESIARAVALKAAVDYSYPRGETWQQVLGVPPFTRMLGFLLNREDEEEKEGDIPF